MDKLQIALATQCLQVVTPVYASPMRVAVNLDSSRAAAAAPAPTYPDICFALDGFDDVQHHMARAPSCKFQSKPHFLLLDTSFSS